MKKIMHGLSGTFLPWSSFAGVSLGKRMTSQMMMKMMCRQVSMFRIAWLGPLGYRYIPQFRGRPPGVEGKKKREIIVHEYTPSPLHPFVGKI